MEETFNVGQTIWHKSQDLAIPGPLVVRAIDVQDAWVRDDAGISYTVPLCDLTSVDPNKPAEPAMQPCPVCGSRPMVAGDDSSNACRIFCPIKGCMLGPTLPTRIEAIQSWNSITIVKGAHADKFKVGDEVLIVGVVIEVDDTSLPYKIALPSDGNMNEWFAASKVRANR